MNLGAGGQPLVAFALVPQLDFQGPPSPSTGAGSLGPQVPTFGDQMDHKLPAHGLRVRALESVLAQQGTVTVSLEILTLSLPLNSLRFSFFSSVNGVPMPAPWAVVGT